MPRGYLKNISGLSRKERRGGGSAKSSKSSKTDKLRSKCKASSSSKVVQTKSYICHGGTKEVRRNLPSHIFDRSCRGGKQQKKHPALVISDDVLDGRLALQEKTPPATTYKFIKQSRNPMTPIKRICADDCHHTSLMYPWDKTKLFSTIVATGLSTTNKIRQENNKPLKFCDGTGMQVRSASEKLFDLDFKVVGEHSCGGKAAFKVVRNNSSCPRYFEFDLSVVDAHFGAKPDAGTQAIYQYLKGKDPLNPGTYNAVERHHPGRRYSSDGSRVSFGYDGYTEDKELKVLPALESAISRCLFHHPQQQQLKMMVAEVYKVKNHMLKCGRHFPRYEYNNGEDQNSIGMSKDELANLQREAEKKTKMIAESIVKCTQEQRLALLSCAVYKSYLQQNEVIPSEDWHILKNATPTKHVPSIQIITSRVMPFLGDGMDFLCGKDYSSWYDDYSYYDDCSYYYDYVESISQNSDYTANTWFQRW
ncbi:MAG: hypothetical protein SGILL_006178 [Bacillariaceae sp.]